MQFIDERWTQSTENSVESVGNVSKVMPRHQVVVEPDGSVERSTFKALLNSNHHISLQLLGVVVTVRRCFA
jgi:hypothetical protein